ncbi:YXWGXW repeat-containing protein [Dyella jejuensis]|uniref:YXWGXW repeat-containing protein n=1 Tax=Dyella jejuensis TaxID=1432009 RepID=A0ABW8JIA6_9GAMM
MQTISISQHISTKRTWLMRASVALLAALVASGALPQKADAGVFIGVGVSVGIPPPPLPVYVQPPIPASGYMWTPGYWAWNGAGYYWVPGTWVLAPYYGALWTPGYWGWDGGFYVFHPGYWGRHVGFYGGVNYGYGYTGVGYAGGYWGHGGFYYNRSVNRFGNVHVANVYNRTVINNTYVNRTSYNGGRGGLMARPTPQDVAFARDPHTGPVAAQQQQMTMASHEQALRASFNHGNPPIAATSRAGAFAGAGVAAAHGAAFSPAAAHVQRISGNAMRAQPGGGTLRSASYAPHANTATGAARPAGNYGRAYRPAGTQRPGYGAHRASTYRGPAPAYRPASQSRAQPRYHAQVYHPAARPTAPRGGGGHSQGHDSRRG